MTIEELLTRGVAEVIDKAHMEKRLRSGEKLRVKLGIDPTSPDIHLGRAVVLLKLRDFQELGHKIVFIIGDFTGTIGDTSDKDSERPMLSPEVVKKNMKEYARQAAKILDVRKTEIKYNSKWLAKLRYADVGFQADAFSLSDFIDRDNIKRRLDAGKRVSLRELLYPLAQSYDSVAVECDIEIGGTDQKFNLLSGRTMQKAYGQEPQDILTTNLILGTDGRKMSSSWGNTITLRDSANDMFGKIMAIPDALIVSYFTHCTRVPMNEVNVIEMRLTNGENPRDEKMKLAKEIVRMYHGDKAASAGETYFISTFQKKEIPDEISEFPIAGKNIIDALIVSKLAESKSEARRLIAEKGVKVNNEIVMSSDLILKSGDIIQKGKRFFAKVK
jgi:tyrosyl-tRNA synthetase